MVYREALEFCAECGGKNPEKYRPTYCSRPCRLRAYNRRAKEQHAEWVKADRAANPEKYVEYRKKHDNRKRAGYEAKRRVRVFRNAPYENVDFDALFERDGWVCKLCLKPVDKGLKWPERESASADHIIPVSKGGGHTENNLQLAHLVCNISKGNRVRAGG